MICYIIILSTTKIIQYYCSNINYNYWNTIQYENTNTTTIITIRDMLECRYINTICSRWRYNSFIDSWTRNERF